jgi:hypothetical protein
VKKSKRMQLLFFGLIPVGMIILIFSITMVKKTINGNIILEIPFRQKSAEFILPDPGNYSIWHKGQFFRKAPLEEYKPEIISQSTGQKIGLSSLLLRPNKNNGINARMELYRFYAPAGKYILELTGGSSISAVEKSIIRLVPAKEVDVNKYFIQVRESQSTFLVLTGIVLIVLGGLCVLGGLVIGILANQIFRN